jgi:hypothetical protein
MTAWVELSNWQYDWAWCRFESKFKFQLEYQRGDKAAIREPRPSITYSVSWAYEYEDDPVFETMNENLNTKALKAFRKCIPQTNWLYVLDWQHVCYRFHPHAPDAADVNSWPVSIFPEGDYHIFLSKNLKLGLFGQPWETSICVFGEALLKAFEEDQPDLFTQILRRDGIRIT